MQPIGTITNYFPFLEDDTISVLKSVMEAASNYYDFAVRLGNKVSDEDVSLEIAYMAAMHLFHAYERGLQEKLREKYIDSPEILVWTFPRDSPIPRDEVLGILSRAIENNPPDWILIDLYNHIECIYCRNPSELSEVLRKIEALLKNNPNLACFESYLPRIQTHVYELEGDSVNMILACQKALELARKVDDVYSVISRTGDLAAILRNHNASDALEYVEEYNRLSMQSGLLRKMELARHWMGVIYVIRGEYDMALECQFAAAEVRQNDTEPSFARCAVISYFYSNIEDGKQELHWAKEAFRVGKGKGSVFVHGAISRALIHLGQLDDADHHLNILHKLSLESANERDQADYLYGRGFHELKSGNPQTAIDSLEQALSIYEQLNQQVDINPCLIALTKAEIQHSSESGTEDSSGPWMVRLESHARKKDYPGIRMHAALLRAEFYVKQGRKEEAQEVLRNALSILDSPSVKTLRKRIKEMLDALCVA